MTDALRIAAENTARTGGGTVLRDRWLDLERAFRPSDPGSELPRPEESAEETVNRIARAAGIAILDTDNGGLTDEHF